MNTEQVKDKTMDKDEKEIVEFRATTIQKLQDIDEDLGVIHERISKRDEKLDDVVSIVRAIKWLVISFSAITTAIGTLIAAMLSTGG